ncbi:MAG: STAS domain-containing protein [Lachnospiraceae bacterium]|nr:STAS domain-containing protein [Lachnospiraceae bacterium]
MEIKKEKEGMKLVMYLSGRLDTITAPQLQDELTEAMDGISELVMDLKDLEYVSSAGLRVLLFAQKEMMGLGGLQLINVTPPVMEVFDITGFSELLGING